MASEELVSKRAAEALGEPVGAAVPAFRGPNPQLLNVVFVVPFIVSTLVVGGVLGWVLGALFLLVRVGIDAVIRPAVVVAVTSTEIAVLEAGLLRTATPTGQVLVRYPFSAPRRSDSVVVATRLFLGDDRYWVLPLRRDRVPLIVG